MVLSAITPVAHEQNWSPGHDDPEPSLLIVEDHPLLAEYMATVAEDAGWNVEVAESAKAFEQSIGAGHPEVIALDLGLPDGDGVELIRHLSAVGYEGAVLIISGCDEDVLESCGRLAGLLRLRFTGHVQKPLTASDFEQLLDLSGARPSSTRQTAR